MILGCVSSESNEEEELTSERIFKYARYVIAGAQRSMAH